MQIQKLYGDLLKRHQMQKEVAEAKRQFEFKPFLLEYMPLKKLATFARWGLSCFSIATGFGCLYHVLGGALPLWLSAALSVGLLLFVELLKSFLSASGFRQWYGANRFPLVALPALAAFGLSVFLSMQGVQMLYKDLDNGKAELMALQAAQLDSINSHYGSEVARAEKALSDFRASVSWKGKINIHNPTTAQTIDRYGAEIQALRNEQRQRLTEVGAVHQKGIGEAEAQSGFNLLMWVCISVCVEFSILGCLWFLVYYAFRVTKEAEVMAGGERYTVNISDLRTFADTVLGYGQGLPLPIAEAEKTREIGFRPGGTSGGLRSAPDTASKEGLNPDLNGVQGVTEKERELRAFLAKYEHVVQEIERGSSNKETVQNCGVSLSTVHNVKRCLRSLGE